VAKTYVALAADGLVAVVLGGKGLEGRLNDTTTEAEDQVEGRLLWWVLVIRGLRMWSIRSSRSGLMGSTNLLDVVVRQGAAILELLSSEDETLLVRGNSLLVLDLALHIVDCVRGLDLKGDGLARQGLNEAVAEIALVLVPSFRSHAQVVRCGGICVFAIRRVGVHGRVYVHLHCSFCQ
jgi:hypothetical protein